MRAGASLCMAWNIQSYLSSVSKQLHIWRRFKYSSKISIFTVFFVQPNHSSTFPPPVYAISEPCHSKSVLLFEIFLFGDENNLRAKTAADQLYPFEENNISDNSSSHTQRSLIISDTLPLFCHSFPRHKSLVSTI